MRYFARFHKRVPYRHNAQTFVRRMEADLPAPWVWRLPDGEGACAWSSLVEAVVAGARRALDESLPCARRPWNR
jgi:hypothetical protein